MQSASKITVTGFVTQVKFLNGRRLSELERYLGFHAGRLTHGAVFVSLDRLPTVDEFETRGYSQVADHRYKTPTGLDMKVVKRNAMAAWSLKGPNALIKVMANTRHNAGMQDDDQYPPGSGVPQWKVLRPGVPGTVVATVTNPNEIVRLT